jgi:hypothetical protein
VCVEDGFGKAYFKHSLGEADNGELEKPITLFRETP